MLAGLSPLTTPAFTFEQPTLTGKVGDTVALRFESTHTAPHSFDMEELNVHIGAAPGT
jgi:heme/copper-type cytochrome/quinol oxidase subunit 2